MGEVRQRLIVTGTSSLVCICIMLMFDRNSSQCTITSIDSKRPINAEHYSVRDVLIYGEMPASQVELYLSGVNIFYRSEEDCKNEYEIL